MSKWARKEKRLTEKQLTFAKEYAATGNAAAAALKAYPDTQNPKQMGYTLKNKVEIREYIATTAYKCAQIQMEMIESEDTPAAVRNDAIKFRLNAVGIGEEEADDSGASIQTVIIKIDNN